MSVGQDEEAGKRRTLGRQPVQAKATADQNDTSTPLALHVHTSLLTRERLSAI
jgi:hypothetical protein